MNDKTKKILNIAANVLCAVIFVLALLVLIQVLVSQSKGYVSFGGKIYLPVESYSMNFDENDDESFTKGDIIVVRELSDDEKPSLKVGDIITFWDRNIVNGQKELNTHRIVDVRSDGKGGVEYQTKGDANTSADGTWRVTEDIVGIYESKNSSGFGSFLLWLRTPAGFGVFIGIPSALLLAYCIFTVIKNAREYRKTKQELGKEELKEQLRQELLAEQNAAASDKDDDAD